MVSTLAMALIVVQLANPSISVAVPNGLIGFFETTEEFHETYTVAPGTKLEVDNANGDIEISRWKEDYVEVYAKKRTNHGQEELDKARIDVVVDDLFRVRTKYLEKNTRVSVHYVIRVPSNVVVDLVKTSNGRIELDGTRGDTEVVTSNGHVNLKDVAGTVRVRTCNGKIEIKGKTAVREANTSNGSIRIDLHSIPEDGSEIVTSNGSIDLYVDVELNADLRGTTSLGKISIRDLALESRFTAATESSTLIMGKIGEGGRLIGVSTSNGEIRLYGLGR
jgi:DUF4097 and DUF4098 domain-containing protein YvlB